jgi:chorismate mutase/GNAT superfamily N-acetyltransferase
MPTDLTLRPAVPEDVETLADLFWAARQAAYPAMPHSVHTREECGHWFREVLGVLPRTTPMPAGRETWVAERDGEVVGYLVLDPVWLDSLYVRADLLGQGIGSALLELAKSLRPGGFSLWVFETNEAAQRFYTGHGLVPVRRTDGSDNEERAPDLEMAWWGEDPVAAIRARIDDVDARLARLLAERVALTGAAQRAKVGGDRTGRDRQREAQIVARMAALAPELGEAGIARIMDTVITVSLEAVAPPQPGGG